MNEYRVTWEIELDASNPRLAAEEAAKVFSHQVNMQYGAAPPVFKVIDTRTGVFGLVDLGENGHFPIKDWQYEVANGDTLLGYDEWVKHQTEAEEN